MANKVIQAVDFVPTYATKKQAVRLKELGFDVPCRNYYLKDETVHEGFEDDYWGDNRIINWNSPDGVGIKPFRGFTSAPEQHVIVQWLLLKHNIWVYVKQGYKWEWYIETVENNPNLIYNDGLEDSPEEAYSTAFDYVFENLI
jgi:hypothetical protein